MDNFMNDKAAMLPLHPRHKKCTNYSPFSEDGKLFFFNNQLANLQFKTFLRIKYDKILIIFCINQCKNRSLVRKLSYLSNPVLFQDVY